LVYTNLLINCVFILKRGNRKAGPDGGNGGIGGNVILEADVSVKQLRHVRKYLKAEDGGGGQTKSCHGRHGKDLVVKVIEPFAKLLTNTCHQDS
jgi:GTP-binding protein